MDHYKHGVLSGSLQGADSINRRRRLAHQQTADVVPRLDSVGYGAPDRQPKAVVRVDGMSQRTHSISPSAPPWSGGKTARRLSPSRFAEREQEPLLTPGLAKSQRIGALH